MSINVRLARPNTAIMHFATGEMMTFFTIACESGSGVRLWANRADRTYKYTTVRAVYSVLKSATYYTRRIKEGTLEIVTDGAPSPRQAVVPIDSEIALLRKTVDERGAELAAIEFKHAQVVGELRGELTVADRDLKSLRGTLAEVNDVTSKLTSHLEAWSDIRLKIDNLPNSMSDTEFQTYIIDTLNKIESGPDVS